MKKKTEKKRWGETDKENTTKRMKKHSKCDGKM